MRLALQYSQLALLVTLHAGCRPPSRPAASEVLSFVTVMSHRQAGTSEVRVDRDDRRTARSVYSDRDAGSVAAGKLADLVLVDGDPTRDIATVRNTATVICRGIVYDPAELFASVGMR